MTADLAANNGVSESTGLSPALYDVLRPESENETIAFLKRQLVADAAEDRRDRVELSAIDFHWPNASLSHRLDHDLGYNPLRLKVFNDATGAGDHVAVASQRTFSALAPSYASPLYALLGLRYIATGVPLKEIDPTTGPEDFPLVARTRDAFVYENRRALPRVLIATSVIRVDFAAMTKSGGWPSVDLKHVVLLDKSEPSLPEFAPDGVARAALRGYQATQIEIDVESTGGGVLVLNDVWHPWWFATVDGIDARVLLANVMFRGIVLTPGRHSVRFRFEPFRGLLREAAVYLFPESAVHE